MTRTKPRKRRRPSKTDGVVEGSQSTINNSTGKRRYIAQRNLDTDKLILSGLLFHGFHGVKPEEKTLGQKFLLDVDAWLDLNEAGKTDNISDSVSYTDIYRIAKEVVEGPSQNLLESVAHLIANTTLLEFPQITAVRVKVGKPHVSIQGPVNYLGVEIMRYRNDTKLPFDSKEKEGIIQRTEDANVQTPPILPTAEALELE